MCMCVCLSCVVWVCLFLRLSGCLSVSYLSCRSGCTCSPSAASRGGPAPPPQFFVSRKQDLQTAQCADPSSRSSSISETRADHLRDAERSAASSCRRGCPFELLVAPGARPDPLPLRRHGLCAEEPETVRTCPDARCDHRCGLLPGGIGNVHSLHVPHYSPLLHAVRHWHCRRHRRHRVL